MASMADMGDGADRHGGDGRGTWPERLGPIGGDPVFRRASVRSFTEEDVAPEQVERVLRAGMAAPSAVNQQPWEFYVVRDAEAREAVSKASPFAKAAAKAPVTIVACFHAKGLHAGKLVWQDMGACVENMLIEAVELGLGAVWLNVGPSERREARVRAALGMPETLRPFCLVALGHPARSQRPGGPGRWDPARVHGGL